MKAALPAAAALAALAWQAHGQDSHGRHAAHDGQHSPTSDRQGPADPHAGHDMAGMGIVRSKVG
ncbi:MAG: hypothetical protein Q8N10_16100 [Phenylobacterium sp.]|uniref:hypothetical protein n=1 Tax=Phenylobacterium sp. TaxID=1871053 RepID=UPI00271CE148|nr:hypothetical protein [Phenylobacterium sp.]MDO8912743.1 hypothetical protein [Phenylobacterium sp.]MDP3102009.1 hypothetical protein [Phenylobacterium sp.]